MTVQTVHEMTNRGLSEQQVLKNISDAITQQGFIMGSNEIFLAGSILFIVMISIIGLPSRRLMGVHQQGIKYHKGL